MKTILLILVGVASFSISLWADDNAAANVTNSTDTAIAASAASSDETNVVLLKDLMTTNSIVTNTVGTVLVKISPTLWAGKYEVTQSEYQKVMGENPSAFSGGNHPVDSVTWSDAMAFCSKLTETETATNQLPFGFKYSLPTEAQWEMLADSADLKDAVMKLNHGELNSTASVGTLGANSYGLYDTRGNVMEWCLDSANAADHVLRGGAWDTEVEPSSRIAFRNYVQDPTEKKNDYGFRVVLEAGQ